MAISKIGVFHFSTSVFCLFAWLLFSNSVHALSVGIYDVFEFSVVNNKTYTNPFDYQEIELKTNFKSPAGITYQFIGFHDGNGSGGQTGNVWKQRFMPIDETGLWSYTYSWSDGTAGGSGSFDVVTSTLKGPLQVDIDNPSYFKTYTGDSFDWRGYDLRALPGNQDHMDWIDTAPDNYISVINSHVLPRGYNFVMLQHPSWSSYPGSWWFNSTKDKFDVKIWAQFEKILKYSNDNGIYIIGFSSMVSQSDADKMSNNLAKYFVARFGAFASYVGYNITWEYYDVYSEAQISNWMNLVKSQFYFPSILTAHDKVTADFTNWQSLHFRQGGDDGVNDSIFTANDRTIDINIDATKVKFPIIGSEDIWESPNGEFGYARNATEVRRTAWGEMMAGVLPLYSEWTSYIKAAPEKLGNGEGESEVRRMFDFIYANTNYRLYTKLNNLVDGNANQIASGILNKEYLIYDVDGGVVNLDLSQVPKTTVFDAVWFDPTSGNLQSIPSVSGGGAISLTSPYSGDSVLFLKQGVINFTKPSQPKITGVTKK